MEKMVWAVVILVLIILGGIVSYNLIMNKPKPTSNIEGSTLSIEISNFAFNPSDVKIKPGTSVTWTNKDSTIHTVTFENMNGVTSGSLNNGQTYVYVFNEQGTFDYHCNIHKNMKGKIIVE